MENKPGSLEYKIRRSNIRSHSRKNIKDKILSTNADSQIEQGSIDITENFQRPIRKHRKASMNLMP